MGIQLGSAYGKISIDSNGVTVGVGNAVKSLGSLEDVAKRVGGSMQKIGGAMSLGLTLPIVAFFKSSVDSAMDAESALAEVNAVLLSTKNAAGLTADELSKMASELQKVTKFSDEEILSGESMLLTFTKIGKDVFPRATETMLNMAEKFGSVKEASIQLGKALNDPVAGVGALRRVGVMLTDQQEQQIKAFMAVNDIASAQKIILDELETEFGGLARAAGDTTAGKMIQLKNAFDDLQEVAGAALIPTLLSLAKAATTMVEAFMKMPPFMQKAILVFLALVALAGPMLAFAGTIISAFGSIAGLVTSLGGLSAIVAGIGPFIAGLGTALATLGTVLTASVIPAIVAFLAAAWPILLIAGVVYLVYLAFKNNFMGITTTVQQLWFIITWAFNQMTTTISTTVQQIFGIINFLRSGITLLYEDGSGALLDLAVAFGFPEKAAQDFLGRVFYVVSAFIKYFRGDMIGAIKDFAAALGIGNPAIDALLNRFRAFAERVISYFRSVGATAQQLWAIIKGAFSGIGAAVDWVISKVNNLKKTLESLKLPDDLTPGSPTPFEVGLRGIGSAMDMLAKKNIPDFQTSLARPTQSVDRSTSSSTTIHLSSGLTLNDMERVMDEKINRFSRKLDNVMGAS